MADADLEGAALLGFGPGRRDEQLVCCNGSDARCERQLNEVTPRHPPF
jgi:hypothetical protein